MVRAARRPYTRIMLWSMTTTQPPDDEPPRLHIRDPAVMRALAHQARLAILEHLMTSEAATATECAAICGLSPSATSYHLRALAKVGLVEQAPGRGDGRERLWRSTIRGFQVDAEQDPDAREAERELIDAFLIREETRTRQWLARRQQATPEWYRAATFNEMILRVSAAELEALIEQIRELAQPYGKVRRRDAPPDAETVALLLRAVPID
jgi:DNA-binding transcriptional ArsR family regulator